MRVNEFSLISFAPHKEKPLVKHDVVHEPEMKLSDFGEGISNHSEQSRFAIQFDAKFFLQLAPQTTQDRRTAARIEVIDMASKEKCVPQAKGTTIGLGRTSHAKQSRAITNDCACDDLLQTRVAF